MEMDDRKKRIEQKTSRYVVDLELSKLYRYEDSEIIQMAIYRITDEAVI